MAKRKRRTSARGSASRRKKRSQDRMPAGLVTLFAGLVLMALAFVPGSSAWRTMHDVLFGLFGCGSFVVGAALSVGTFVGKRFVLGMSEATFRLLIDIMLACAGLVMTGGALFG